MIPASDEDGDPIITVCQGPPRCSLTGDEAIAAQVAGCAFCRVIMVHADGSESVVEPRLQ